MLYNQAVPQWVVPEEKRGKEPSCLICMLGVHDFVDELLKRGQTRLYIRQRMKTKFPKEYRVVRCVNNFDITYHMAHSTVESNQRKLAVKSRKEIMKGKKSLQEVSDAVLDNIAKAIDLVTTLDPAELESLSAKEKFELFDKATKLLQTEKKIVLEANKEKREESEWMTKLNSLGSGKNE